MINKYERFKAAANTVCGIGLAAVLVVTWQDCTAAAEDPAKTHCTAPDGSRFELPPLRKRSINADYLVEYRPYQDDTVWYHSSLDSFGVPRGTTVYLKGGMTGAVLKTRCE